MATMQNAALTMMRRPGGGPVIDTHAHWHAPEFVALLEKEAGAHGAEVGRNERGCVTMRVPGIRSVFQPHYMDLDTRLKAMDATGVDVHALSLTSPMVNWASPEFGLKLAQVYNDALAQAHHAFPTRFVGMATLPMQAPELAQKELERAAKLPGIRGVYMATHINGRNLDEPDFFPIYARCEQLGLPIFLHPVNPLAQERMSRYYLRNFLGNPYESGVAASCLMFGGVMDRFPRLEVMLPHAGGTFPWLIGRMTHGVTVRAEVRHMTRPPFDYLRRFHYDTIGHSAQIIMNLIRLTGADRVVLGSDHPADMGCVEPVRDIERLTELPTADRDLILGGTAARLLRLM